VTDQVALRGSLAAFAEAVGRPLTTWQADTFKLDVHTTVVVAPRQSGKSRCLAVLALHRAFRRSEQHVLIVSASEEAARRLLADIRSLAVGAPLLRGSLVTEQAQLLTLTNGSEIRSVPSSAQAIRGWTTDLLLVDEAVMVPDDLLLGAAFPTTAARPDARIVLASSANTASGAFYDHARRGEAGDLHVRTHRWALGDCSWISASVIESMRASMSEVRFRAEMEGHFASGLDGLFTRKILEDATADYVTGNLATLGGPARLLGGVDWGATNDRSACVAIARVPTPPGGAERGGVFRPAFVQRWEAGYPLTKVVREIAGARTHWAVLTLERNGLGEHPAQLVAETVRSRPDELGGARRGGYVLIEDDPSVRAAPPSGWKRRQMGFATKVNRLFVNGDVKAATYSALRMLIDGGSLVLPASATELLRELLLLRVDLAPSGTERIEAATGHDDVADALALSMAPYRDVAGRWRTVLADLADPRRAAIPSPARYDDAPTVQSGGGVLVPAGPIFQSVNGSHVTAPTEATQHGLPVRLAGGRLVLNTNLNTNPNTRRAA